MTTHPFPPLNNPETGVRTIIAPDQNKILGARALMRYLGIHHILTLYKWVDEFGLPAIKRPDGVWMSTATAIDTWIFMCAELDYKHRAYARGTGLHPKRELERCSHLPPSHPRRRRAQHRYNDWMAGGQQRLKDGPKSVHRMGDVEVDDGINPPAGAGTEGAS